MTLSKLRILVSLLAFLPGMIHGQTVDLVCVGDSKTETFIIGQFPDNPLLTKSTRNYHFYDGVLMKEDGYPIRRVRDDRECVWSQGAVKCTMETALGVCRNAFSEGVIRPEISFCRNAIEINRYTGAITEFEASFHQNLANRGRAIVSRTFTGVCDFAPKRKF